jgi:flavin reductase (DIM6/NTAB) family NADH-FMN oxidoreductase RutF
MLYEPGTTDHGLPYDPFKACVVPRPIGWISTLSTDGVANLAPYSQFQNLGYNPPYVMFSANQGTGGRKHTVVNVENTGEFVWNMATYALREAVNICGQEVPEETDEFELAGLTKAQSHIVKPPRVAESPVHFECAYYSTLRLPGAGPGASGTANLVIGRVLCVHIEDDVLMEDGRLDILKLRPLARLGYYDYTSVESIFEMVIPGEKRRGMEGVTGAERIASV